MAYMSQERKKGIASAVKAICARHGVKGTLAVQHHSTLVLTIASGSIDFFADRVPPRSDRVEERLAWEKERGSIDVNVYWYRENFTGRALAFLSEVIPALNEGNHDNSDPMTDYFDVGWYVSVHVGRWNKPYVLTAQAPRPEAKAVAAPPTPEPAAPPVLLTVPPPVWQRGAGLA